METRGLIHRWVLLGVALFVVVIRVAAQEPTDHYDPDDTKTWSDVVTEDRDVAVRGQQFRVHFYESLGNKGAIPGDLCVWRRRLARARAPHGSAARAYGLCSRWD